MIKALQSDIDQNINGPDGIPDFGVDYDRDNFITEYDVEAIAKDIAKYVGRIYQPFDVNVEIVSASNIDDIAATLAAKPGPDAYILVAGNEPSSVGGAGGQGAAGFAFPFGEEMVDSVAHVYAGSRFGQPDGELPSLDIRELSELVAHETGHLFGLSGRCRVTTLRYGRAIGGRLRRCVAPGRRPGPRESRLSITGSAGWSLASATLIASRRLGRR